MITLPRLHRDPGRPDRRSTSTATTAWPWPVASRCCGSRVGFGKRHLAHQRTPDHRVRASALPLGGYVKMLDEREARCRATSATWRSTASRCGSARPSSLPARRPTCCWPSCCMPRQLDRPPGAQGRSGQSGGRTLAERAGLRAGDWVRRPGRTDGDDWQDVRSLDDLRWRAHPGACWTAERAARWSRGDGRAPAHGRARPRHAGRPGSRCRSCCASIGIGPARGDGPVLSSVKSRRRRRAAGLRAGDVVLRIVARPCGGVDQLLRPIRGGADGQARARRWVTRAGQALVLHRHARACVTRRQQARRPHRRLWAPRRRW